MGNDARLLAKAATFYYRERLSQRLVVSRQAAGRLLRRARDLDIVHVEIRSLLSYATQLECSLDEALQLLEAVGKAAAGVVQRSVDLAAPGHGYGVTDRQK